CRFTPQKRTCAAQQPASALGQQRTSHGSWNVGVWCLDLYKPSTMNSLDFVVLARSALVSFILSLKVFAFIRLSKAIRTKSFGAAPSDRLYFLYARDSDRRASWLPQC